MRAALLNAFVVGICLSAHSPAGARTEVIEKSELRHSPSKRTLRSRPELSNLKDFQVQIQQLRVVTTGGENFAVKMAAQFKTEKIEDLEDYVVVQFIRGCEFESRLGLGGKIEKKISWRKRENFGELMDAIFPNWIVDSVDTDPAFNSNDDVKKYGPKRHALYRWNKNPASFSKDTQVYFFQKPPVRPELYVTDFPSTAFYYDSPGYSNGLATNTSFEFKTCLYRSEDVPHKSNEHWNDSEKAIACHSWDHKNVYNFNTNAFEKKKIIDPFCFSKN